MKLKQEVLKKEKGLVVKLANFECDCEGKVKPFAVEGAKEKHIPVVNKEGNKLSVNVGSVDHPMTEAHLIEWISVETNKGYQIKYLSASDAPKAEFYLVEGEEVEHVYAYCNLHGLWMA